MNYRKGVAERLPQGTAVEEINGVAERDLQNTKRKLEIPLS
jgi:hypothetical protein